jgi:hypothetical protein
MSIIVGSGEYRYRIVEDWAKLPDSWSFKEVAAVGVDKDDNVYCFNRGDHPMMVFDRDGNFLRSWGEGEYPRAHGVHMGPEAMSQKRGSSGRPGRGRLPAWISSPTADIAFRRRSSSTRSGFISGSH